jgi:hypothetical protein
MTMDWEGLERDLQEFERQEWGTNDWGNIKEAILEGESAEAQRRMTGMPEEQSDWEEDDPEIYSHDDAWGKEF